MSNPEFLWAKGVGWAVACATYHLQFHLPSAQPTLVSLMVGRYLQTLGYRLLVLEPLLAWSWGCCMKVLTQTAASPKAMGHLEDAQVNDGQSGCKKEDSIGKSKKLMTLWQTSSAIKQHVLFPTDSLECKQRFFSCGWGRRPACEHGSWCRWAADQGWLWSA